MYLNNPLRIVFFLNNRGMLNWMPDKAFLKLYYRMAIGKRLNLKSPQGFNEKLQWLKLYDRKPIYTTMVDKYEAKKYVADTIGEEYIIPTLGIYDSFDEINFDELPSQFVLKCTHDSGGIVICKDKSKLDLEKARQKINKSLKKNYYYQGREWPYMNIKPRIIAEKYMCDDNNPDLLDYKLMCFNTKVKCSFVCLDRYDETGLKVDFYDAQWNKMPFMRKYSNSDRLTPKPENYEKMVELSEKLSKDIAFVRVDFYEINGRLYFGELTFFPGSGNEKFDPIEWDYKLGGWLELPKKNDA